MRSSRSLLLLPLAAIAQPSAAETTIWATPHDSYSSSVGVLGCKVNTDRIAYWPASIHCTNICVRVSHGGRSVHLLRIDQSGGAYDMSYDAWNYLLTGESATSKPTAGGATAMEYVDVDPSNCRELIHTNGNKLPLSASNSMNFLASCLDQTDSWVAKNYVLYNVLDPICSWGYNEECKLDWPAANQASCPHPMGVPVALADAPVYNIQYPSGKRVVAGTGQVVDKTSNALGSSIQQPGRGMRQNAWCPWALLLLVSLITAWV